MGVVELAFERRSSDNGFFGPLVLPLSHSHVNTRYINLRIFPTRPVDVALRKKKSWNNRLHCVVKYFWEFGVWFDVGGAGSLVSPQ